ncbi:MAG TPA: methyltransferase domain-containing protein [Polyangia bacterium]|nr:methyltransferase domain-containing protein [Polyangia bacterium]
MANPLFSLLRCPACQSPLELETLDGDDGLLRSSCGLWFPVVRGIPRIFVGELRSIYRVDFPDFLARHGLDGGGNGAASQETRAKLATRESFGFEWTHYSEMLPEWERNSRFYFEPLGDGALGGKLVLEGGCGKGRHTYHALKAGARMVVVDFSRAIDVAERNCRDLPGERLFVQADLMALPFPPATFDLAFSFGVLHHLPEPEAGFARLVALVRPGGRVLVYLYHALEGEPLKQAILRAVDAVRRVTVRMPHRALLPATTALGWVLYAGIVTPYKVLSRFGPTRALAAKFPLRAYADYPVRVIVNDQFDRFSAPIENRYRKDEVAGWLARAGLGDVAILPGYGWRAVGTVGKR